MANPQRGEVELVVGGETHVLCLTLGALAEIEGLCTDEAPMTATRLVDVLGALMRGGGSDLADSEIRALPIDIETAAAAVAACFERAGR
jgi:hypothetical protein